MLKLAGLDAIQAISIRGDLTGYDCDIRPGTGREGDVIAVRVTDPAGTTKLIDSAEHTWPVAAGTVILGVLATRDSTTHTSGEIPAQGIPIGGGTPLAWLGGQSGLIGPVTWTPQPGNTIGAQACGYVEALGLAFAGDEPLNIAALSREPKSTAATAPLLVIAGTAAEVGKTTATCRLIAHLTGTVGLTVAAIKPTGSGGIVDSRDHRQAGAAATFDLVDCGLPTSYTDAGRFCERISRILHYAQEINPDVVVCELGGDLVWGNNDAFLSQAGLLDRTLGVLCIGSDAPAALGADTFWSRAGLDRVALTHAPAYFRNPYTFGQRLRQLLSADVPILADISAANLRRFADAALSNRPRPRINDQAEAATCTT
ncbi:hypothetical protein ACFY36_51280 [Actinoplanes sp. NPDC000266]